MTSDIPSRHSSTTKCFVYLGCALLVLGQCGCQTAGQSSQKLMPQARPVPVANHTNKSRDKTESASVKTLLNQKRPRLGNQPIDANSASIGVVGYDQPGNSCDATSTAGYRGSERAKHSRIDKVAHAFQRGNDSIEPGLLWESEQSTEVLIPAVEQDNSIPSTDAGER